MTAPCRRLLSWAALSWCCVLLSGCQFSPPLSAADKATLSDCRSDADRIYNARNRAQLSERDSRDSPFSGGAQVATPSDGLADRYSHEEMVDDCVRHGTSDPGGGTAVK